MNVPVAIRAKVTIGAFSRKDGKLFSELKLVTENLPSFMQDPMYIC